MDKTMEQRLENLLETFTFDEILEYCGLTDFEVLEILFENGHIDIENEPL